MLVSAECIPCMLNMAVNTMRSLSSDQLLIEELMAKLLRIPTLRGLNWETTCPEVVELITTDIMDFMDNGDPFKSIKSKQNNKAMEIYPWLKGLIEKAYDPFYTAVNLAIYGNFIDVMIKGDKGYDFKTMIKKKLKSGVQKNQVSVLQDKLARSKLIVYFGDNSGEIVFDRILIETLKPMIHAELFYIVRSVPTLNDVTMREAEEVGLNQIVTVLENGINRPVPGTVLARCSDNVVHLIREADLIISKGGGNFETLTEDNLNKDVSYLLMSKCWPICRHFKALQDRPILHNVFVVSNQ